MEFTREIYWNVGHGVILPMYGLAAAAVGAVIYGSLQRLKVYRRGKPLPRTDDFWPRLGYMAREALLQAKVLRVKGSGLAHALFFGGFFLLFLGTCLILVQADFTDPLFGLRFLKGNFYKFYSLILDLAGLVAIAMLLGLGIRRYLVRPEGLETGRGDALVHALLLAILISGFVVEGQRMAATEMGSPLAAWSPVGHLFARLFAGMEEPALRTLHALTWWGHLLLGMAFLALLPFTKLRHIFTTSANYFFADRGPTGKMATLDLEDEAVETFGAARIEELAWKDIFDADACTLCKRCQDRCPAHGTGKPLSPMRVVKQIGEAAFGLPGADLVETVSKDVLWACTTCLACQDICPAAIEHVRKITDMRRNLVLMEGDFPGEEVVVAVEQTEVNGNPLGMGFAARGDWTEGLPVVHLNEDAEIDVLYFVGCFASFDKRNIAVARSFVTLCAAAGVKVGILGKREKCCGEPVRKLGNEYLYQAVALENIEAISGHGVRKVVTTCPHCFNTLNRDYRDLGFEAEVEHYTVFLEKLVRQGALKFIPRAMSCTYHDSCYLGRYNGILAPPRSLLRAAGGTIAEMPQSGRDSFCCGAGGGRILAEERIGDRINQVRVKEAAETGAPVLVSNCPFCLTMFEDGVRGADLEGRLVPRDIAEILVDRLPA